MGLMSASCQSDHDLRIFYHIVVEEMRKRKGFVTQDVFDAARADADLQWDLMKAFSVGGHRPW